MADRRTCTRPMTHLSFALHLVKLWEAIRKTCNRDAGRKPIAVGGIFTLPRDGSNP